MLVDYNGILLFLPFLLCYFFIFFSFQTSSFGLLSLLIKLLEFLSITAFSVVIFSITSLNKPKSTVSFAVKETSLHRVEENKSIKCFHRPFGIKNSFSGSNRSWYYSVSPSLYQESNTEIEDILGLFMQFFQDVLMLLLQKISHFLKSG